MQKLAIGMNANTRGFTLIEILVVIIIIGITIGFALLAFGDFGADRRILFSAEQLANTIKLAQQQAILETSTFGVSIDQNSYSILKFQGPDWISIQNKGIFKKIYFPKNTIVSIKTNTKSTRNTPSIIISPSGDLTAFSIILGTQKEPQMSQIIGNPDGTVTIKPVKSQ